MERRLSAIFAADMVGYSRLMEADEVGTLQRQRAYRRELIDPAFEKFHGRIVKEMGDGILVEFPSVVEAVQCAVAVQRAMPQREAKIPDERRISYRVGINLGDIIVDGNDIQGDGVNVAARLEAISEPGGICISGTAYDHIHGQSDFSCQFLGEQQLKNISRPIRTYRVDFNFDRAEPAAQSPLPLPDKPSVAVLPFENMSGDTEQEYFADGMTEDLITDLSKISNLFVVARNSSFSFKGQMPDVREVAARLGVKFVLEGSVRKMGGRLRINAQLINAEDGGNLWAERYDGDMEEIFEFQDRIRDEIVATLKLKLTEADEKQQERKRTTSIEAYDLYLRGRACYYRYSPENLTTAEAYFTKVVEVDPNMSEAYAYLSRCILSRWIQCWQGHDATLDRAIELAERAVAIDNASVPGHIMLAFVQNFDRKFDESEANFERAIALDPYNSEGYVTYAAATAFWGNPNRVLQILDRAKEIDPVEHPNAKFVNSQQLYLTGQYETARATLSEVIERQPGFLPARVHLIATLVALNRVPEAQEAVKDLLKRTPSYSVADAERVFPYKLQEDRKYLFGALRKAGLPE